VPPKKVPAPPKKVPASPKKVPAFPKRVPATFTNSTLPPTQLSNQMKTG
jgi:hypothetical protein